MEIGERILIVRVDGHPLRALGSTWIRRIPVFKKGPRGPSNAGEKALMLL
jgi:hypothetical protein